MGNATSIPSRNIKLEKITQKAQKIILDHIRILNGKNLWESEFYLNRDKKDEPITISLAGVPSPESYEWLKKNLKETNGKYIFIDSKGFSFMPSPDGYLILNDRNEDFISNKRFKARNDFAKYLKELNNFINFHTAYEEYLKNEKRKDNIGNYKYTRSIQEAREIIRLEENNNDIAIIENIKKIKKVERIDFGFEKKFAKKFGFGNYENYKKFKQRARKDGLI